MIVEAGGMRVCVINLIGMLHLQAARSPFAEADALLDRLAGEADAFVVDFHAEVTSEKVGDGLAPGRPRRPRCSAPTPTCRPPTPGSCRRAPRSSATSA